MRYHIKPGKVLALLLLPFLFTTPSFADDDDDDIPKSQVEPVELLVDFKIAGQFTGLVLQQDGQHIAPG